MRICVNRGKTQLLLENQKGLYGLADIPTIFQEKIDRTLGYCIPVWLEDILIERVETNKNTKRTYLMS